MCVRGSDWGEREEGKKNVMFWRMNLLGGWEPWIGCFQVTPGWILCGSEWEWGGSRSYSQLSAELVSQSIFEMSYGQGRQTDWLNSCIAQTPSSWFLTFEQHRSAPLLVTSFLFLLSYHFPRWGDVCLQRRSWHFAAFHMYHFDEVS